MGPGKYSTGIKHITNLYTRPSKPRLRPIDRIDNLGSRHCPITVRLRAAFQNVEPLSSMFHVQRNDKVSLSSRICLLPFLRVEHLSNIKCNSVKRQSASPWPCNCFCKLALHVLFRLHELYPRIGLTKQLAPRGSPKTRFTALFRSKFTVAPERVAAFCPCICRRKRRSAAEGSDDSSITWTFSPVTRW